PIICDTIVLHERGNQLLQNRTTSTPLTNPHPRSCNHLNVPACLRPIVNRSLYLFGIYFFTAANNIIPHHSTSKNFLYHFSSIGRPFGKPLFIHFASGVAECVCADEPILS